MSEGPENRIYPRKEEVSLRDYAKRCKEFIFFEINTFRSFDNDFQNGGNHKRIVPLFSAPFSVRKIMFEKFLHEVYVTDELEHSVYQDEK